jgi:hypothetical protein
VPCLTTQMPQPCSAFLGGGGSCDLSSSKVVRLVCSGSVPDHLPPGPRKDRKALGLFRLPADPSLEDRSREAGGTFQTKGRAKFSPPTLQVWTLGEHALSPLILCPCQPVSNSLSSHLCLG